MLKEIVLTVYLDIFDYGIFFAILTDIRRTDAQTFTFG